MCGPILNNLDPQGRAPHRLFKEHMNWSNGVYWKNLKLMNRDLSRVVLIEGKDRNTLEFNQENTILIEPWDGESEDNKLRLLIPFLLSLAQNDVKDVREIIRFYENENTAENWIADKKQQKKTTDQQKRPSGGFLGSGMGRKPLSGKRD